MPGIQDPNPSPLSSLGQPIILPISDVVTPATVQPLADQVNRNAAFALGMTQQSSGAAIEQQRAEKAAATLATAQAQKGLATLNTGDLVQKHLMYSTPIIGPDGKPDYSAMSESGMNYRRAEMMLQYAQAGLTAQPPIETVDPKTGLPAKVYLNSFGEHVFDQKTQDRYHKLRDAASQTLMGKPKVDSWHPSDLVNQELPEGGVKHIPSSDHQVPVIAPNTTVDGQPFADVSGVYTDESAPQVAPLVVPTNQPVLPSVGEAAVAPVMQGYQRPVVLGTAAAPFDAAGAVASYQNAGRPVVLPDGTVAPAAQVPFQQGAAAPVTVNTPTHTVTVQPNTPPPVAVATPQPVIQPANELGAMTVDTPLGQAIVAGNPQAAADKLVEDARKSDYVSGWSKVKDVVNEFNSVKNAYTGSKEKITSQKDVALANTLIRLQNPAGTGRGFGELHVENLEKDAPRLEQLLHIKGLVLKEHAFTPETRKRLIEEGNRLVDSIETPARSELSRVASRISQFNLPLARHLNSDELSLIGAGGPPAASAGGTTGPVRVLNDGTRVRIKQ